jgi:NDP-sugar pyrophosphorylase family protein
MFVSISFVFLSLILGVPTMIIVVPLLLFDSITFKIIYCFISPWIFVFFYVLTAGILSFPFQKSIISGKFKKDLANPIYRKRRYYGLCWTAVYYCTPIYFIFLSIPLFKKFLFRLFGYKGHMDFTIYPDTWVRDLPLLNFGKGAYLSNRATIGTNVILKNGKIVVDSVTVEENGLLGHLSILGPGTVIQKNSEVGVASVLGFGVRVKEDAQIGGFCAINHLSSIGNNTKVSNFSYIGVRCNIGEQLKINPTSRIKKNTNIQKQEDITPETVGNLAAK